MKTIAIDKIDPGRGRLLNPEDRFRFRCHPGISCFNLCCRNLNLFLYPYDVIRLKNALKMDSDRFLEDYVDVVLREGAFFPEVLLRMADNAEKTCPFLTPSGCGVYANRPHTCRAFPVETGLRFGKDGKSEELVYFFRPPEFCQGQHEFQELNIGEWFDDQDAKMYNRRTAEWAEIRGMLQRDPWRGEGPQGKRAKMTFMSAYNMDTFRNFVFESSFLKRYKIKKDLLRKMRRNDAELLKLGFDWIRFYLWGMNPRIFKIIG